MSTSSSDSDLAATSFFSRPQELAQQSIRRESKKLDKQKRKNSQWVQQNELESDQHGGGASGSSSDIMIVQDEEEKENRKKRPAKEKEKEKKKSTTSTTAAKKKKKDSSTSTSTSTKKKTSKKSSSKGSHVLSSSDSELEPLPFAAPLTTATQRAKDGDELRELARKKGGWQGSTPPDRVARRRLEQQEEEERRKRVTPESDDETTSTTRRRISASTAATSLSSATSHSSKPPPTRPASKASTSTATTRKRRIVPPPPASRSPSPQLQPLPPVSFWGAESHLLGQKPNASSKAKVGEKSEKLRSLSEQRNRILDLGDGHGEGEDEIVQGSSSDVSEGDGRGRYENVANREKRKRAESLAKLQAKRAGITNNTANSNSKPSPFRPVPNNFTSTTTSNMKGKSRATEQQTIQCQVCNETINSRGLERHLETCAPGLDEEDDLGFTQAPPQRPLARAGPSNQIGFRAAGTTNSRPRAQAPPRKSLENELFPSQEEEDVEMMNGDGDGYGGEEDEDDLPIGLPSKRSKGKGKEVLVRDSDEEGGGFDEVDDEEGYFDSQDDDLMFSDSPQPNDDSHNNPKSLHKTVITIDDDDEEDDLIIEENNQQNFPPRTQALPGRVNSARAPGPPTNGSPPPRGSLYLSTMSRAWREGYEKLYSHASGHKTQQAQEEHEREFDPMRPQKMTTANPPAARGGGRGGGRGRGGRRGGFRARGRARKR